MGENNENKEVLVERRRNLQIDEDLIDEIVKRVVKQVIEEAPDPLLNKMKEKFFISFGEAAFNKLMYAIGAILLGLYFALESKGFINIFK